MSDTSVGLDELDMLQRDTLRYFLDETNRANGLVPDSTRAGTPSSITAIGFALAAYAVGAERNVIPRGDAVDRVLTTLRFLWHSPHGEEKVASLPFAPQIVLPTIRHFGEAYPQMMGEYGLRCSFNHTFGNGSGDAHGWHRGRYYGLVRGRSS